ncbi:hypothetical protein D3X11_04060 [Streptococcus sp. X16XC17]|uniref:hypothetical protein n=1 Tax=unclassified Streptococcus TaxID=2608887 RepID=UPI00066FB47C|nr:MULTISPECIES: hypothetical protein [unclassified Streptococcus]TCD46571.1 hypothetical protein D3X11_04060 [Streptococcus sp. X16XC17]
MTITLLGQDATKASHVKVVDYTSKLNKALKVVPSELSTDKNVMLYDITPVDKDSNEIHLLDSPAMVALAIDPNRVVDKVYYVLPTGDKTAVESLKFTVTPDGTFVSFEVSHFSLYAVVYKDEAKSTDKQGEQVASRKQSEKQDTALLASKVEENKPVTEGIAKKEEAKKAVLPATGETTSTALAATGLATKRKED